MHGWNSRKLNFPDVSSIHMNDRNSSNPRNDCEVPTAPKIIVTEESEDLETNKKINLFENQMIEDESQVSSEYGHRDQALKAHIQDSQLGGDYLRPNNQESYEDDSEMKRFKPILNNGKYMLKQTDNLVHSGQLVTFTVNSSMRNNSSSRNMNSNGSNNSNSRSRKSRQEMAQKTKIKINTHFKSTPQGVKETQNPPNRRLSSLIDPNPKPPSDPSSFNDFPPGRDSCRSLSQSLPFKESPTKTNKNPQPRPKYSIQSRPGKDQSLQQDPDSSTETYKKTPVLSRPSKPLLEEDPLKDRFHRHGRPTGQYEYSSEKRRRERRKPDFIPFADVNALNGSGECLKKKKVDSKDVSDQQSQGTNKFTVKRKYSSKDSDKDNFDEGSIHHPDYWRKLKY